MRELKWQPADIMEFLRAEFPQALTGGRSYQIDALEPGRIRLRFTAGNDQLRPGGTVSGAALMELVDFSVYVLLLAHHKSSAMLSVTTNFHISFLRKAEPGDLLCDAELIKHGRTLSVADARVLSADESRLIAHAGATYYMADAQ